MLQLTESYSQISKKINVAIAEHMNALIQKKIPTITDKIRTLCKEWIAASPEIVSLNSADPTSLAGAFGIPAPMVPIAVDAIVESVSNSLTFSFTKLDDKLRGGLEIRIQPIDFQNLLSLSVGHVVYERGDLHWLDWLLTKGASIIITNYQYQAQAGTGRSGLGTMKIGGSFRVPPKFAGTTDNNFVTRALSGKDQEDQITNIISSVLT